VGAAEAQAQSERQKRGRRGALIPEKLLPILTPGAW
jgi:hypothetical protein